MLFFLIVSSFSIPQGVKFIYPHHPQFSGKNIELSFLNVVKADKSSHRKVTCELPLCLGVVMATSINMKKEACTI